MSALLDSVRRRLVGSCTGNDAEVQLPVSDAPPASAANPSDASVFHYLVLCQTIRDPPSLLTFLAFIDNTDEDAVMMMMMMKKKMK